MIDSENKYSGTLAKGHPYFFLQVLNQKKRPEISFPCV